MGTPPLENPAARPTPDLLNPGNQMDPTLWVVGMVNSSPEFGEQAQVVDGASDLFVALFGDRGRHARSAPGMGALPGGNAVIVECVIEVDQG